MTVVLREYEALYDRDELLDDGEESETLATDLLDKALSWRTWRGMWAQGVFNPPPCLEGRDRDVAGSVVELLDDDEEDADDMELEKHPAMGSWALETIWENEELETASLEDALAHEEAEREMRHELSIDRILQAWRRPSCHYAGFLRSPILRCVRESMIWPGSTAEAGPSAFCKVQRQTDNSIHHAANLKSALDEDLDHTIWSAQWQQVMSDERALHVHWPPHESLANLCLMEKMAHRCHEPLKGVQRAFKFMSKHIRAFFHLWCLRCYRQRRKSRDTSMLQHICRVLDAARMLPGTLNILAIEAYIAWTDERVHENKDSTFWEKVQKARLRFLETETAPASYCAELEEREIEEPGARTRSFSCAFWCEDLVG